MKSVRRHCITLTTVNSGYASKVLAVAADVTAAPDKWPKARHHCLSTLKFGINLNFLCIRYGIIQKWAAINRSQFAAGRPVRKQRLMPVLIDPSALCRYRRKSLLILVPFERIARAPFTRRRNMIAGFEGDRLQQSGGMPCLSSSVAVDYGPSPVFPRGHS